MSNLPPGCEQADIDQSQIDDGCSVCGEEYSSDGRCDCSYEPAPEPDCPWCWVSAQRERRRIVAVVRRIADAAIEAGNPPAWLRALQIIATSAELEEELSEQ